MAESLPQFMRKIKIEVKTLIGLVIFLPATVTNVEPSFPNLKTLDFISGTYEVATAEMSRECELPKQTSF